MRSDKNISIIMHLALTGTLSFLSVLYCIPRSHSDFFGTVLLLVLAFILMAWINVKHEASKFEKLIFSIYMIIVIWYQATHAAGIIHIISKI